MDQRLQDPAGAVPPDWRGLCEELIEALETAGHRLRVIAPEAEQVLTWTGDAFAAAARASALLAQPEPEVVGPSLEEVEDLCEEHCFNVEGYESIECLQGLINDALARWGRPALAHAEGEVEKAPAMSKPPLWWAMQGAYFEGRNPGFNDAHGYAAEIRALRDWLVPEEPLYDGDQRRKLERDERQHLRNLLTTEADRAERGDG